VRVCTHKHATSTVGYLCKNRHHPTLPHIAVSTADIHAPLQQVTFNISIVEAVRDLIGGATVTLRNTEKAFHVFDFRIGNAPRPAGWQ
jgi:hypothetical protein